jgi:hypothetical protein
MKNMEKFLKGEVVYHTPTHKAYLDLIDYLSKNTKLKLFTADCWMIEKERICIRSDGYSLSYADYDWYEKYKYEIVEFKSVPLKDKIDTSTVVKLRKGDVCCLLQRRDEIIIYDKYIIGNYGGQSKFIDYCDNLLCKCYGDSYDIMAYKKFNSQSEAIYAVLNEKSISWDWQRQEPLKLTKAEIAEKFNCIEAGFVITD